MVRLILRAYRMMPPPARTRAARASSMLPNVCTRPSLVVRLNVCTPLLLLLPDWFADAPLAFVPVLPRLPLSPAGRRWPRPQLHPMLLVLPFCCSLRREGVDLVLDALAPGGEHAGTHPLREFGSAVQSLALLVR